jgi:hypothetical protein
MRRASDDFDAVGNGHAGHRQRSLEINRAVVNFGKEMAMKVDQ